MDWSEPANDSDVAKAAAQRAIDVTVGMVCYLALLLLRLTASHS